MLKNTKGMTLVEMIVTIAIFSIAALVLAAGFSTVIRYMGEASAIKNTSNEVYANIQSAESKDVTYDEIYFKIQLDDGNNVDNKIKRVVAEKRISDDKDAYKVSFNKFSMEVNYVNNASTFYKDVKQSMEYLLKNKTASIREYNAILSKLKNQNKESVNGFSEFSQSINISNDMFIQYFFVAHQLGESYPTLDQKVINQCNKIFNETKGLLNNDKINNVQIANKKMYMKCILIPDNLNKPMVILVADEYPYTPKVNQWRTRLIYNHYEECWYYKIHTATANDSYSDSDYYYNVTSLKTAQDWDNLVNLDFKDKTKWRKIEINNK